MLWSLTAPPANDRGPRYTQQVFAALHALGRPITLLFAQHAETAGLFLDVEPSLAPVVAKALQAHHPDCRLRRVGERACALPDGYVEHVAALELVADVFALRTWSSFEEMIERHVADPISTVLSAVSRDLSDEVRCCVRLQITPAGRFARHRLRRRLAALGSSLLQRSAALRQLYIASTRRFPLWTLAGMIEVFSGRRHPLPAVPAFRDAAQKCEQHLFACRLTLHVSAPPAQRREARRRLAQFQGSFAQFTVPGVAEFRLRRSRTAQPFLLSADEVAALWHPPIGGVETERLARSTWREREPPPAIASERGEGSLLGRVAFRGRSDEVRLNLSDRRRHLAIFGQSGTGKSTLLESLITADMQAGHNVACIDPHGDLIEALLQRVPSHRTGDVILFDAADHTHPVGFNPLACGDKTRRPLVVAGIVSALKKLYGDSWGPRLEHILTNTVYALVGQPGATMLSVLRMLGDGRFRDRIVARIDDPVVRSFWREEFAAWNARFRSEAVSSVQNKIAQLVTDEHLRMITGQAKSTIDIRRAIDHHILLVRLPKGTIGDATSSLLGSLLVTSIQQEAMGRSDTPEEERPDLMFYCDEFQNFATPSFAVLLSEARKYHVSLCTANQLLSQVPEETLAALFGNCGSLVSFRVGSQDSEAVSEQLTGKVEPADLIALPNYTAYVRLLSDGVPQPAFSMRTLPPAKTRQGLDRAERVRRHSRHRYGRPRALVEAEIAKAFA